MMRALLLSLSESRALRQRVTRWPAIRRMARRFVAGERLEEALEVVRRLNAQGCEATLDHLGENTTRAEEARRAAKVYLDILDRLHAEGLRSHVSLKLTQMGLDVDEALCRENVELILERARRYGTFVRVDMESSAYTERTLALYRELRRAGFENVGVVIQSYLYRSAQDVEDLIRLGANVRLCKGAYREPPEVAFPRKREVDAHYLALLGRLLSAEARGRGVYTAIATHDERIIRWALEHVRRHKIPQTAFEFQMLYGIRRDLQGRLARQGHTVRVYVSYGLEWYPYFMRRLAERPANVLFLLRNLLRR